jgi:hypothetical protein
MERITSTARATVSGGFYINRDKLDLVVVSGKQGPLPDEDGDYFRVPAVAALLLAPLLGGLFVAVVPCLGLIRLARRLRRSTLPRLASLAGTHPQAKAGPPEDDADGSPERFP